MLTIRFIVFALFLKLNQFVYSESIIDLSAYGFDFTTDLANVSQKCQDQLKNLNHMTLLTMFSASAKLSDDLLIPLFYQMDRFDKCYDIDYQSEIYGKYCLGAATVKTLFSSLINYTTTSNGSLRFGYCLPNECVADDFHKLFNLLEFDEKYCYSKATEPKLSAGAIITISILCFFLALVVLSTLFDLYLFYTDKMASHQLMVAFSAFTNGKKLIKPSNNPNQLLCLDGLRAISMIWVVLFHVYSTLINGPPSYVTDYKEWLHYPFHIIIYQGNIAVDTFFTIGGILVVYTFSKAMERSSQFNICLYYLHRYLRLTPLLAIIVLIHAELIEYLGNDPLWAATNDDLVNDCKTYWWSALLYLQNYVHGDGACVRQSWYLSVDFQLYLLSPIVLLVVRKSRKFGMYMLYALIVLGFLSPNLNTYFYELQPPTLSFRPRVGTYIEKYYNQTYIRFGPYVIGMLAGYLIYDLKKYGRNIKLSTLNVLVLWSLTLGTLVACIVGPYDIVERGYGEFHWYQAVVTGFVRNVWSIGICFLIILCLTGYGGPINWFLSLPVFQLLSKLSYATYLIHCQVNVIRYARSRQPISFRNEYMIWRFCGDFAISVSLSVLFYLMFEAPMTILGKCILALFERPKHHSK